MTVLFNSEYPALIPAEAVDEQEHLAARRYKVRH